MAHQPPSLQSSVDVVGAPWRESAYYEDAERWTFLFWEPEHPFRPWFDRLDLRNVLELACGYGRHAERVAPLAGQLTLMDIRVQKGPKQEGDSYYMITRMPVAWWWLPVQEHPGDMEVTRGWHVMSAIHNYIATHKDKDGNLEIKDDKTGETLPLEFVEIHQPVRHLKKEGEYFACTDFRKPGSQDEYYDIDFWVNEKTGKLEVDNVKVHKVPVQEDGVWAQVPRYNFDGMDIEVTN